MADELVDIYDQNMNLIGQAPRSQVHREGLWHNCFICWIVDAYGKLWFQLRSKNSHLYPSLLDASSAGHVKAGEKPKDGVREVEEELGLSINKDDLVKLFTTPKIIDIENGLNNRAFWSVYVYKTDKALRDLKMQPEEVDGVFAVEFEDLFKLFEGKVDKIKIKGLVRGDKKYTEEERVVGVKDFCPHGTEYYLKVFNAIDRYLRG